MSRATFALHYIKRNSVKRKRSALSGKNGWIWVFPSLKSRSPSSAIELGRRIDNGRTSILSIPGLHTREGSSHLRPSRWCRRELILPRWIFQKSLPLQISTNLILRSDTVEKELFTTEWNYSSLIWWLRQDCREQFSDLHPPSSRNGLKLIEILKHILPEDLLAPELLFL